MKQYVVMLDAKQPYVGQLVVVQAVNMDHAKDLANAVLEAIPEPARNYHKVWGVTLLKGSE